MQQAAEPAQHPTVRSVPGSLVLAALQAASAVLGGATFARAQDSTTTPVRPTSHAARLTATYDGDGMRDVSGGLRRGGAWTGELSLQLLVNGSRALGWRGTSFYAHVAGDHGTDPSELVGDAQGVSSLAPPTGWRLDELWAQQAFGGGSVSVLAGRYDVNSEFYRLETAGLFLNSSFGIGPEFSSSGTNGPSTAPYTAVGARVAALVRKHAVMRLAIMNGAPVDRPGGAVRPFAPGDGVELLAEAAVLFRPRLGIIPRNHRIRFGRGQVKPYGGKLAIGVWDYTARFADLADTNVDGRPLMRRGSRGAYLLADQTIWEQDSHPERTVAVFGQVGIGDSRVERFGRYYGGGADLSSPLPDRDRDELGFGIASARNGGTWMRASSLHGLSPLKAETTWELTYLAQIGEGLAVQPDVQRVRRPGSVAGVQDAWVLAVRLEISR